jgi:hypothetical protein
VKEGNIEREVWRGRKEVLHPVFNLLPLPSCGYADLGKAGARERSQGSLYERHAPNATQAVGNRRIGNRTTPSRREHQGAT